MKLSKKIYDIFSRREGTGHCLLKGADRALSELHPGENEAALRRDHVIKKINRCLLTAGAGVAFAVLLHISSMDRVFEDYKIKRDTYGGEATTYQLRVDDGERNHQLEVDIMPRQMTEAVFMERANDFREQIDILIRGDNENLEDVRYDLLLEEEYPGFPFAVNWKSSVPEVIDNAGRIHRKRDGCKVKLSYTLYYGEFSAVAEFDVTVIPSNLTDEESEEEELRQMLLSAEENSRYEEQMTLPAEWNAKSLCYKENRADYSGYVFLAVPILTMLLFFLADYDLMKEADERKQILKREYPEFVNKLVLFVGAGMSVRGAFSKLQKEYAEKDSPCGREIRLLCGHLAAGMSESNAYEQFGRRTGVRDYIRLCALLTQNLKRGNAALLDRLIKEAERSSEDDLLLIKKKGEEAGTKLLVPMVLLLGIIMVIIIVPAFSTL